MFDILKKYYKARKYMTDRMEAGKLTGSDIRNYREKVVAKVSEAWAAADAETRGAVVDIFRVCGCVSGSVTDVRDETEAQYRQRWERGGKWE